MRDSYTFIVVGGGIAGVSCIESLPFWAESEPALLISASPYVKSATNAVQVGKVLTRFDVEEQSVEDVRGRCGGVDILIGTVVEVDSVRKEVVTDGGKRFGYQMLCIATGGKPKLIAENNPYVIGIRDTDSVIRLKEKLSGARRIVVVGNGGIATEIVYEVGGVEKVWVVKDEHISSTFVDAGAAEFLRECLLKNTPAGEGDTCVKRLRYTAETTSKAALGPDWHSRFELRGTSDSSDVKIEYSATVTIIENTPNEEFPVRVTLSNGQVYDVDFIVSATGVTPTGGAIKYVSASPELAIDGGIVVNERLCSSVAGVYAVGDVATAGWQQAPQWHQMRLWTQARQMGQYAAKAMALELKGEPVIQDFCFELFSHMTQFFGFKVILLGLFNGQKLDNDYELLLRVTKGTEFVKLVLRDGKLQGAILIGETDLEEMCENLILDQLDVSQLGEDLLNPDIDIEDYFD